jgi:hypothetical protein
MQRSKQHSVANDMTREAGFDFHLTKPVNEAALDVLLSLDLPPPGHGGGAAPLRH